MAKALSPAQRRWLRALRVAPTRPEDVGSDMRTVWACQYRLWCRMVTMATGREVYEITPAGRAALEEAKGDG